MGTLNEHGASEIIERYSELMSNAKKELIMAGYGQDAIDAIEDLINRIYETAYKDNYPMWENSQLVMEFRKIGIDKWGKEAKDRLTNSGIKTTIDLDKALDIATKCGMLREGDDDTPVVDEPIYKGWV